MTGFSAQELLTEVSADEPCGANMEYDPLFQEMERASRGKPEQRMGEAVVPAEDPDWRTVKNNALEILSKSKDLRAASYLTHASLHIDGWQGFAEGLKCIEGLIQQYWDSCHPQLDPDDDNDPTMRVNIIGGLSDEDGALTTCHRAPLVTVKGIGPVSKRYIDIAVGDIELPKSFQGEAPNTALFEAAFNEADIEELQEVSGYIAESGMTLTNIENALAEVIPITETPNLSLLAKLLKQIQQVFTDALERRGVLDIEGSDGENQGAQKSGNESLRGTVQSREDVIRVIDQVCEFYRRSEPSSPVPILLQRARKLVNMDFMDIMRTLTPGGLSEAETIRGPEE